MPYTLNMRSHGLGDSGKCNCPIAPHSSRMTTRREGCRSRGETVILTHAIYRLAYQAVVSINFLHSSVPSVLHRDIKSLNFMLSADWTTLKLIDFGLSKVSSNVSEVPRESVFSSSSFIFFYSFVHLLIFFLFFFFLFAALGTTRWRAPETFDYPPTWTAAADIYSLGVTLYEIASRKVPFEDVS